VHVYFFVEAREEFHFGAVGANQEVRWGRRDVDDKERKRGMNDGTHDICCLTLNAIGSVTINTKKEM